MATCKDCLCYKLCVAVDRAYDNEKATIMEKFCPYFKDKSRFVEIVRCKDCKYFDIEDGDALGTCMGKFICVSSGGEVYPEPNHYCSYGERRSD